MITNKDYEKLIKPLLEIYNEIEIDLLLAVAERFKTYEDIGGTLQWQVKKLDELGILNKQAIEIITKYSKKTNAEIEDMLNKAGYDTQSMEYARQAFSKNLIKVNPSIIYKSESINNIVLSAIEEGKDIMHIINTKAIESTKKSYMKVLDKAYLEVSSGIYDYNTSIKKAIMNMANEGIDGATYQRDGKIIHYSIEGTVRRDILTHVHQTSSKCSLETIKELGINTVYVPPHLGARVTKKLDWTNHSWWQGKIYLLEGQDKKYGNFYEVCGYGKVDGHSGVNCRHPVNMYIEGVTKIENEVDMEENKKIAELTTEQRRLERNIREQKKRVEVAKTLMDRKLVEKETKKLTEKNRKLREFLKEHEELSYDASRVKVQEKIKKGK